MASRDDETEKPDEKEGGRAWIRLAVALGLIIVAAGTLDLFVQGIPLSFTIPLINEPASASKILYYASIIIVGAYIGLRGLEDLLHERRFSVELLMSIAAFGATYLDLLFEGATVLFLYSLAEHFEDYIEDRARKTIENLSRFMPDRARVVVQGSETSMNVREVQPGMIMLVKPGERIALDGAVVGGTSSVDQSLVTGESTPVPKKTDDDVYAGTLNLSGVLRVVVRKKAEQTLVSRITSLVIESRKRKASIERFVDKFARFYVPTVIALAAFTAMLAPNIAGGPVNLWLYRSLTLLVVSCPSAFVISVPATVFTSVTMAARKGVVIKGGAYLEKMDRVKTVVFDKTGTLTLGRPVVHDIKTVEGLDPKVLTYAAALERFSNHPIAQAIVRKASEQSLPFDKLEVKNVEEIPGKGIMGQVDDLQVIVGNMELMQEYGCNCEEISAFYQAEKHTAVCISINEVAEASFCVMDAVRRDATEAVNVLKNSGIRTVMLTGDKREIAQEVAVGLGIDEVYSELFPEDKMRVLDELKLKHGSIAMVGDGVNDAPALAASDVGIAMGGSGVDVTLETADVVLVKDELIQVPYLIRLSNETLKIAKQNVVASLCVKAVLGALGLMGLIPLWFAVAAGDDGLTMLVLLNTLRLARVE